MSDDAGPAASGNTDATEDVDHHLGGTAATFAGFEVFAPPEEPARFTVDVLEARPPAVDLGIYSDGVSGRALLEPDQARALADRLATAAAEVEQHRADE